jgi:hypothetical protein
MVFPYKIKLSLFNRIFKVDSIVRDFNLILLAKFISDDTTVAGTLLESVHTGGFSPSLVAFNKTLPRVLHPTGRGHYGVADSLSTLLYHGNFNNKGSRGRRLAELMLRAFMVLSMFLYPNALHQCFTIHIMKMIMELYLLFILLHVCLKIGT